MPTSKSGSTSSRRTSGSTRRRSAAAAATPTPEWEPVLSGSAGIIPGEVVLTLSPDAAATMTGSVPVHPAGAFNVAADLGVDDLDSVLADLGAHDITRLAPSPVGIAGLVADAAADLGLLPDQDHILSRSFRVRIDPAADVEQAVARLSEVASVEVAEPNRWRETTVTPNDPQFGSQWGLTKINAPAAWDISTGSPSVVVGIIDSGCDLDHPELAPLLISGFDMVDLGTNPTPPAGFRFEGDFSGRDATPEDEVGHGTHVAGTIAALSNNGVQVAGVGWQTKIMPVKALTRMVRISDGQVRGVGSSADVAAAVRWAADNGAHVINMSLGADAPTTVESDAVAYAIGKGVVVVAAMGNNGTSSLSYPAAYPGVVAVGAIDSADKKASFSQTGPHISLCAPGVGIVSTYLAGGTTTMSGTSMATPHVSGVAALIKAVKPSATGAEIADILRTTARPLRDNPGDPVPNDAYGHGCLDAHAALVKARGPVIFTTITTRLRTPIIACPPRTVLIKDCLITVNLPICPPKTIKIIECGPKTVFPPQCPVTLPPTTTITITPTTPIQTVPIQTVPTQQIGRGAATAGYDPYGLLGGQAGADAGYEAGYAAGYAAAMAEVEAAVAAAEAGLGEGGATGGGTENVQAGVGDVFRPLPFPRSVFVACWPPLRSVIPWQCVPRTIGTPFCPVPTPTITPTFPTTPQLQQPGLQQPGFGAAAGYGEDYGYDPYGQNPFQG